MRIFFDGIKLPGTSSKRNRSPIHLESLVSSLLPFTAFTHLGLAMVTRMPAFFKNIEHRDPILARRFHTNIKAVVCVKPIGKAVQVGIVSRKAFLLVVRLYAVCGRNDRSNQKGFVNVHPTTNRINNFQKYPSSNEDTRKRQ